MTTVRPQQSTDSLTNGKSNYKLSVHHQLTTSSPLVNYEPECEIRNGLNMGFLFLP